MSAEYILRNGKKIIVREATIEDLEELNDVENRIKAETDTASAHPKMKRTIDDTKKSILDFASDDKLCYLVLIYEGKIVAKGHIDNWIDNTEQNSELVIDVLKTYWGLGIGGKLMQELLKFAAQDLTKINLSVASKNIRAINLYKSFGFVEENVDKDGWQLPDGSFCDCIDMVKDL